MIGKEYLLKIERFIQKMPPLPVTATKVLEVAKDSNIDAQKLNSIISLDPVLTGKILKLINSAYYALPNQITSIVRAIILLGLNTVKNLVLSASVISSIKTGENFNALDMEGFWRHSICVGTMAKMFALRQGVPAKLAEEYFVAGLLHDIGKIPLNSVFPDEYTKTVMLCREKNIPLYITEQQTFGFDHCEVGSKIAESWKLNEQLKSTITRHHSFSGLDDALKRITATVALADIVTNRAAIGFSGNSSPDAKEDEIFEITGLNWNDVDKAEEQAESAIKKAEVFLQIT